jgi:hypothetical protein
MARRLWTRIDGEPWMVNPRPARRRRNPSLAVIGLGNPRRGGPSMARHRRRRNPARAGSAVQLTRPTTWAPLGTGALAAVLSASAPKVAFGDGATTTQAYAAQAVLAFGGSWVLRRWAGPVHGMAWLFGAGAGVLADPVRRALARAGVPGLSAYGRGTIRGGALDARLGAAYYGNGGPRYYMGASTVDLGLVGPARYGAIGAYGR